MNTKEILSIIDELKRSAARNVLRLGENHAARSVLDEARGRANAFIELECEIELREREEAAFKDAVMRSEWGRKFERYRVEHRGIVCLGVSWSAPNGNLFILTRGDHVSRFITTYRERHQNERSFVADTDYIHDVIDEYINEGSKKE